MPKLTILRGLSGSGKSTWADAQPNAVVVSRDRLRVAMFGSDGPDYYKRGDLRQCEDLITKVEHGAVKAGLVAGQDVISDNTNIEVKYMKPIAHIGYALGATVQFKIFDVPLHTAIERNNMRAKMGGRNVPEAVIRKQHDRFQHTKNQTIEPEPTPTPYNGTPGSPKAFLVDIDGTLAHMHDRRGPFDWKKVGLDEVDDVISNIVFALATDFYVNEPLTCIVMSGRDEVCRKETEDWLNSHGIPFDYLFMRPEKDMRKDSLVKAELFDKYVRDLFDVQFVLDDRQQVVDMWRAMGIKTLQVEPGDF